MTTTAAILPGIPKRPPDKIDILRAIILRETRVRFGHRRLGYLWAIMEPTLHIIALCFVFHLLARSAPIEEGMPVFFASGVLPWLLFVGTVGRTMSAVDANRGLLVFPHLYPIDFMVGRIIMESVTLLSVAAVLALTSFLFDTAVAIKDPLGCLLAWLSLSLLGGGIGIVNTLIVMRFPSYDVIYGTLQRILYFFSGVFFLMNDLPDEVRKAMAWNPVLHAIEWFRSSLLNSYTSDYAQPLYVVFCALAFFTLGLSLERRFRGEIRTE